MHCLPKLCRPFLVSHPSSLSSFQQVVFWGRQDNMTWCGLAFLHSKHVKLLLLVSTFFEDLENFLSLDLLRNLPNFLTIKFKFSASSSSLESSLWSSFNELALSAIPFLFFSISSTWDCWINSCSYAGSFSKRASIDVDAKSLDSLIAVIFGSQVLVRQLRILMIITFFKKDDNY